MPLDCFWSHNAQELIDVIGDAREPQVVTRRLQAVLSKLATNFDSPDVSSKIILQSLARSRDAKGPITRQLASALGTSERTLRRHCEQAFGYGPKTLNRILRMQRFLNLARTSRALDLALSFAKTPQDPESRSRNNVTGLSACLSFQTDFEFSPRTPPEATAILDFPYRGRLVHHARQLSLRLATAIEGITLCLEAVRILPLPS